MNFSSSFLSKLFKKNDPQNIEINRLFNYLADETDNLETIESYTNQFKKANKRYGRKGDSVFIGIYLNWEDFIVTTKQTTKENFRQEIRKKFNIDLFSDEFKLIFLEHRQKTIFLYEHFVESIVEYIIKNLGYNSFKRTIQQLPLDSIFNQLEVRSDGISFNTFNNKIVDDVIKYPIDKVTKSFKGFATMLYYSIEGSLGEKVTHDLLNDMFKKLQTKYDSETASTVLKIAPEKVLDFDRWLSVLSKGELEKQVREKTIELEKLNNTLEQKVRERTIELEKAYEDLKEVDKLKSEFISVAAHQLRTPLSGIKWTMNLLRNEELGPLNEEQKKFVEKSYNTNEVILEIVNNMLNAQELSKGRSAYQMEDFNLNDVIDNVISDLTPQAQIQKIEFKKVGLESENKIYGDRNKIKNVLENIADNAVKYSKEKGNITFEVKHINNLTQIAIADNGIGVPESQKEDIFKRFFRADNAKRVETNGSGLGLFISKNIIEDHGGRIWFQSEEGKGTTFYITLPTEKNEK
jgi:signal transduction histidine kinase